MRVVLGGLIRGRVVGWRGSCSGDREWNRGVVEISRNPGFRELTASSSPGVPIIENSDYLDGTINPSANVFDGGKR